MQTLLLNTYRLASRFSGLPLKALLHQRLKAGKEHPERILERQGQPSIERPDGSLLWLHAASVGEAQSALILIDRLLAAKSDLHILITTGTLTSAELMERRLPEQAVHQFYPLDHPKWCRSFLNHWKPNYVIWMESELWPNMILAVRKRKIPAILLNARLSMQSFNRWSSFKGVAEKLLSTFKTILAQTETDHQRFDKLGHKNVPVTDNIKYSAAPLPFDEKELSVLKEAIGERPCWVYASTHDGEEKLACDIHKSLKERFPNLLTIIVPRHPERRDEIAKLVSEQNLNLALRSKGTPVDDSTDIYIADTLGELGLFYNLCPIAVIGRSFSNDGGGGHNPIEAAQADCAVLSGPHIEYQSDLFDTMLAENAVYIAQNETALTAMIDDLLSNPAALKAMQDQAQAFAKNKADVIDTVMEHVTKTFKIKS
ncbi:MAG: 3-deoxy-D-manno-octulosonic acid transferase [Pseudomonadota bacterium]